MDFVWDPKKAESNFKKHGVRFEEATEVFADIHSSTVADPDHSQEEHRFLIFGQSTRGNHIVASFAERNGRMRIINARHMTRK